MTAAPLVSIIIVNYNTAEVTGGCLASIRRHARNTPHEVIVVDNASQDDSPKMIAESYPEVRLLTNRENVGFGPANNQAAAAAQGRYLFFLNSDTKLLEDSISVLVEFLESTPRAGAVGCRLYWADGRVQPSASRFPNLLRVAAGREVTAGLLRKFAPDLADRLMFFYPAEQLDDPRRVDWCVGAALMVRREAFEGVSGFDPRIFLYTEEMDLCLRLAAAGWETHFTPATSILHLEAVSSGRVLNQKRLAYIAAGHRYFYLKHNGFFGCVYCLVELSASVLKAVLWSALGFLTNGEKRRTSRDKARWHLLYLKKYFSLSY